MLSLQEISDRLEIQDLMVRYSHAVDTQQWDVLDTVFTPDAHRLLGDGRLERRPGRHQEVPGRRDAELPGVPAPHRQLVDNRRRRHPPPGARCATTRWSCPARGRAAGA
ncbi:nuclear transport factor 2 family protein [Yinghuangia aomiensis]